MEEESNEVFIDEAREEEYHLVVDEGEILLV